MGLRHGIAARGNRSHQSGAADRIQPLSVAASAPASANGSTARSRSRPTAIRSSGRCPGCSNFWAACGCMGGFSQGGAIGKVLSNWIVDGDPGTDIFGMDVARYGAFASDDRYLRETTAQFYARRFVIAYPNEELPAGRPLKTTPSYAAQRRTRGALRRGLGHGVAAVLRHRRARISSNRRRCVAPPPIASSPPRSRPRAPRAGLLDTGVYARYEVTRPAAPKRGSTTRRLAPAGTGTDPARTDARPGRVA